MARILFVLPVVVFSAATASAQVAAPVKPVWPDEGPMTWAPRPTTREITATDLRTRFYGFADDSMSGRRIGEPGNYKGTEYIAREFKRFGLKPAGDNGTFFQDLPFGPIAFDSTRRDLIAGARRRSGRNGFRSCPARRTDCRQGEHRPRRDGVCRPMGRYGRRARSRCVQGKGRCVRCDGGECRIDRPRGGGTAADTQPRPALPVAAAAGESLVAIPFPTNSAPLLRQNSKPPPEPIASRARSRRRGGAAVRDSRAATVGAAGMLLVALDSAPRNNVNGIFNVRTGMHLRRPRLPRPAPRSRVPRRRRSSANRSIN